MAVLAVIALLLLIVGIRNIVVVPDRSAYVVERLGRYHRTLHTGAHVMVPFLDVVRFRYALAPREEELSDVCISLDNIAVRVASSYQWEIADPRQAAYAAADAAEHLRGVVRAAQRQRIGERPFDELRETTRELQQAVLRAAAEPAAQIGAKIASVRVQRIERAG